MKQKTSRVPIAVSSFYLSAVIAAVVIMLVTAKETAMSGIFLIMVTMPWSLLVSRIQDALAIDSTMISTLLLVAGGLLNTFIIYKLFDFITNKSKRSE